MIKIIISYLFFYSGNFVTVQYHCSNNFLKYDVPSIYRVTSENFAEENMQIFI